MSDDFRIVFAPDVVETFKNELFSSGDAFVFEQSLKVLKSFSIHHCYQ